MTILPHTFCVAITPIHHQQSLVAISFSCHQQIYMAIELNATIYYELQLKLQSPNAFCCNNSCCNGAQSIVICLYSHATIVWQYCHMATIQFIAILLYSNHIVHGNIGYCNHMFRRNKLMTQRCYSLQYPCLQPYHGCVSFLCALQNHHIATPHLKGCKNLLHCSKCNHLSTTIYRCN